MSKSEQFTLKPFGNVEDAKGFYQLLREHLAWLKRSQLQSLHGRDVWRLRASLRCLVLRV